MLEDLNIYNGSVIHVLDQRMQNEKMGSAKQSNMDFEESDNDDETEHIDLFVREDFQKAQEARASIASQKECSISPINENTQPVVKSTSN